MLQIKKKTREQEKACSAVDSLRVAMEQSLLQRENKVKLALVIISFIIRKRRRGRKGMRRKRKLSSTTRL